MRVNRPFAVSHCTKQPWVHVHRGRFPFNENASGLKFLATSSSEWNSIFQNFQKRAKPREVYPNFRKCFPGSFLSIQLCSQNFQNFRLNGSHFGNSTVSRISGNFSGNFGTIAAVSKFSKVLVEWKVPHVKW